MKTRDEKLAIQRRRNHAWYDKHKKEHNAVRRKKYQEDPEYREKILNSVTRYRESKPRVPKVLTRVLDFSTYKVLRIPEVCAMMGRSQYVLRGWEKNGVIPRMSFKGTVRVYTPAQADLLVGLALVYRETERSIQAVRREKRGAISAYVHYHWEDWKCL